MARVVTRDQALTRAAACIAEGRRLRDSLSVEEAARRAHHAGGPSIAELERRIRAGRAISGQHGRHAAGSVTGVSALAACGAVSG